MKVAFLSDIHSNLHALQAVLATLERLSPDKIVVLGDTVGYNAYPAECLDLVVDHADVVLLGNHDAAALDNATEHFNPVARAGMSHTTAKLEPRHLDTLKGLRSKADVTFDNVRFTLVHGSLRDPLNEYVFPGNAGPILEWMNAIIPDDKPHLVAAGHTHIPMYLVKNASRAKALHMLNPGSVGQPRDGDPRAAFAVFDTATLAPSFHRVPYDIQAAVRALEAAKLPRELGQVLTLGR